MSSNENSQDLVYIRDTLIDFAKELENWKFDFRKTKGILRKVDELPFNFEAVKQSKFHEVLKKIKSAEEELEEFKSCFEAAKEIYEKWKNQSKERKKKGGETEGKNGHSNNHRRDDDGRSSPEAKAKADRKKDQQPSSTGKSATNILRGDEQPKKEKDAKEGKSKGSDHGKGHAAKMAAASAGGGSDKEERYKVSTKFLEVLLETSKGMASEESYDEDNVRGTAHGIERALWDKSKGDMKKYKSMFKDLFLNVKDKNHLELRQKIVTGDVDPVWLVSADPKDLLPEEIRKRREQTVNELASAGQSDYHKKIKKAGSSTYSCEKCHSNQVQYYQQQVRGADEPMTTFFDCESCGHKWTHNQEDRDEREVRSQQETLPSLPRISKGRLALPQETSQRLTMAMDQQWKKPV